MVGDGEAETGPLEGSWKGISFLNPCRDGAVLPILHLNGYKISGPTVLGRSSDEAGRGPAPRPWLRSSLVEGDEPFAVHTSLASVLDRCLLDIRAIQNQARSAGSVNERPRWPVIVLRTPKGWTGPREIDGLRVEGTFRSHQVPVSEVRTNPAHPGGARALAA